MRKPLTIKSTMKNDPFAGLIPEPVPLEETEVPNTDPETMPEVMTPTQSLEAEPAPIQAVPVKRVINTDRKEKITGVEIEPTKPVKQKLTVHLAYELADRVKNAAYWNPRLTIAKIAEQGIKYAIEKYERENGGRFQPREGDLIGGRPIK